MARHELQNMLNQGYEIRDNRVSKADVQEAFHRSLESFEKPESKKVRLVGDVNVTLPPGFGLKKPSVDAKQNNNMSIMMQPSLASG